MSDVVPLKKVDLYVNDEAVKRIEGLLDRLRCGESVAMAFVEIERRGIVSNAFSNSDAGHYHQLMSGTARLQWRLASMTDDETPDRRD